MSELIVVDRLAGGEVIEVQREAGDVVEVDVRTAAPVVVDVAGEVGPRGPQGDPGADGADGQAATVTVGSTTTGAPGSNASVTNVGSSSAAVLDFVVPRGAPGAPGADGNPGPGVAAGGSTGQVLAKASNTDYDTTWVAQSGGVPPSRQVIAGDGLDGGGPLSGDVTLDVNGTVVRNTDDTYWEAPAAGERWVAVDQNIAGSGVGYVGVIAAGGLGSVGAYLEGTDAGGALIIGDGTGATAVIRNDADVNGIRFLAENRVAGADGIEVDDYATVGQVLSALSFIDGGAP